MKPAAAVIFLIVLAGCSSTSSGNPELDVSQKIEVECVASNFEPNGCTTSHKLGVAATFSTNPGTLPSADDLRAPGAGESEF
jgi:predicted component of type VI protein secretion system